MRSSDRMSALPRARLRSAALSAVLRPPLTTPRPSLPGLQGSGRQLLSNAFLSKKEGEQREGRKAVRVQVLSRQSLVAILQTPKFVAALAPSPPGSCALSRRSSPTSSDKQRWRRCGGGHNDVGRAVEPPNLFWHFTLLAARDTTPIHRA